MTSSIQLLPSLRPTLEKAQQATLPSERRVLLDKLAQYIVEKLQQGEEVHLNFICTHNSRRSQLAQVWAQTMASLFQIPIKAYSGGTEATAFNERAVEALKRDGFKVSAQGEGNPTYSIAYSESAPPILAFSKLFDDPANQVSKFAAIMTCAHAEANCPFIPGTEQRISLPYEDPKAFDGTLQESEKYSERSLQIASEMYYVFSKLG